MIFLLHNFLYWENEYHYPCLKFSFHLVPNMVLLWIMFKVNNLWPSKMNFAQSLLSYISLAEAGGNYSASNISLVTTYM